MTRVHGENSTTVAFQHDGYLIERYAICGSPSVVHVVYEPSSPFGPYVFQHSTITSRRENGEVRWYGRLGTRDLPAEVASLKGQERIKAYKALRQEQHELAYRLIAEAFPMAAAAGKRESGEIVTNGTFDEFAPFVAPESIEVF